jgi:hypothetical protein
VGQGRDTLYILEDEPPADRPRWYCHEHPAGFDDVDGAVAWALSHARTAIIRTLGESFYYAGEVPADPDDAADARPWPPSRAERARIDARYEEACRAAAAHDAAYERYREARDEWLLERASEFLGADPSHQCWIDVPGGGTVLYEEYDGSQLCAAWHQETWVSAFGNAAEVIGKASGRALPDQWVEAVVAALTRERGWRSSRRQFLDVRVGSGKLFHVTAARNRDSIREHGLDWTRMSGRGIAGSTAPELDAVFLCYSLEDAEFFTWMGVGSGLLDIWEVDVGGLVLESGPDGWLIVNERIGPERLRLAVSDLVPEPPEPTTSGAGGSGYIRIRRDDGDT